jgi:hypothetical protein
MTATQLETTESITERTEDFVRSRLEEAGVTLLCIRDFRGVSPDIAEYWRHVAHAMLEYYDLWRRALHWPVPNREKVGRMWETLGWLRHLSPQDAQLVISRSVREPGADRPLMDWRPLAKHRNRRIVDLQADFERATATIARALDDQDTAA